MNAAAAAYDGPALIVRDLVKKYGDLRAVDGISFTVEAGEIFGLLGPNGAGKTTTLEIVEGIRRADSGFVQVVGIDVNKRPRAVRERVGVQLQEAGFFESLTVRETLTTFAAFHTRTRPVDELLESLNLAEKAKAQVQSLSGGQRQRLSIALALINDPAIVFLDEPTTGLDPQARRNLWDVILDIRKQGRTVVLTTHYMDEAQQLCDRIAIIDHGKIMALDTPSALIRTHAPGGKIVIEFEEGTETGWLRDLPAVTSVESVNASAVIQTDVPSRTLPALFSEFSSREVRFQGLRIEEGTLEDVFLNLTGRRLRE